MVQKRENMKTANASLAIVFSMSVCLCLSVYETIQLLPKLILLLIDYRFWLIEFIFSWWTIDKETDLDYILLVKLGWLNYWLSTLLQGISYDFTLLELLLFYRQGHGECGGDEVILIFWVTPVIWLQYLNTSGLMLRLGAVFSPLHKYCFLDIITGF